MTKHLNCNNVVEFEEVNSTNSIAQKLLSEGRLVEGSVIIAQFQRHGKGFGSNAWESLPGKNLLMSMVLYPSFIEPAKQFLLHKISSLAVMETVRFFTQSENIFIKWPNDIYSGNKKIAGILTKNIISGSSIVSSVIGIGLNVNQDRFSENLPNPISLKIIAGRELEIRQVLNQLCKKMRYFYNLLQKNEILLIDDLYLQSLLNLKVEAKYRADGEIFMGEIQDVTDFGRLQVRHGNRIREFDIKEIEYLFD
jgi:BirA family biotin operon repressor/biotin-[acetyl-CoA-carboxylase] ligase